MKHVCAHRSNIRYVCTAWHVQAEVGKEVHILGQAGELLGQVLGQVKGTIDVPFHLHRIRSLSFGTMSEQELRTAHSFCNTACRLIMTH